MGNLVAQMAHLARGQETIAGREHHLVIDEAAGHAVIVGTSIRALDDRPDGTIDPAEIEAAFRDPNDPHEPISGLVTIENTHAHSMGQPLTPAYTRQVADIAHAHGVPLHVDGARFWNAVVAQGAAPDRPGRPGRHRHVLPVEGPRPARSARWSSVDGTSSGARAAPASWSVAGCARPGSWPRPGWSPCPTDRTA